MLKGYVYVGEGAKEAEEEGEGDSAPDSEERAAQ